MALVVKSWKGERGSGGETLYSVYFMQRQCAASVLSKSNFLLLIAVLC